MRKHHRLARSDEERCEALTVNGNRCSLVFLDSCEVCGLKTCYKHIRKCPNCGLKLCVHCAALVYKENQGKCPRLNCSFVAVNWNGFFKWECPRRLNSIQICNQNKKFYLERPGSSKRLVIEFLSNQPKNGNG
jgi:hypothetical protein